MNLTSIAIATALLAVTATTAQAAEQAGPQFTTQLPRTVRPTHYDIGITPDTAHLRFDGKVAIAIDVLEPTATVTLNALDLKINSVQLTGPGETRFAAPKVTLNPSEQTATFTFDKPLAAGSYRLAIDYQGKIYTQASGLFAIDYDSHAGHKRALYTQFENSDARRFIPSWDEPAQKATFTLEATVANAEMAVSNTPVEQKTGADAGRTRVRFAATPKMSTYLLFLGIGEFDRITAKVGNTEVGVVTQMGLSAQGQFALESSQAILREYNDYFAIPYPLAKLDNIASPGRSQFFGAMENWGAIYTFEYAILLNPKVSTQIDKQGAFITAAHEMAHQWFGDLVTMSWWDDLWLNEGFATWMEGRTTAKLHPEWNTRLDHVDSRESAIGRDALATTHAVVQRVENVEQASQAFDSITYQKGSAVIRMIEDYVGADAWRDGVRNYLRKHTYGNTVSDDLWREIEASAKKPILAIAHDFTLQPGVPLLRVGEAKCTDNTTTLELTQSEFSKDQPNKAPLSWHVPVIVKLVKLDGAASEQRALVTNGKATVKIPGCGTVIVNSGQSGYYRTLYSGEQLAQIKNRFTSLKTIDQLGILADTWALGSTGYRPTSDILELVSVTPVDADPKIWRTIAGVFDGIDDLYRGDPVRRDKFRAFAIAKLSPVLARVGWTARRDESDSKAILREALVDVLGGLGDRTVIAEADRLYRASQSDANAIPAPLRKAILGVVALHANAATWEQLRAQAAGEKTALIKDDLYRFLSTTEDEALARRALELSLTAEPGATNSAPMIARVASLHPELAFDFALAHLDAVDAKVDSSARSGFYPGIASGSSDPATIPKIKAYAEAHVAPNARRRVDTAIAQINYRIKIRAEHLPAIDAWLTKNTHS